MSAPISSLNTIDVYSPSATKPWNAQRIQHLYQRLGFGASRAEILAGLAMSPDELVDNLLDGVANMDAPTPEDWSYWTWSDYDDDLDLYQLHQYEIMVRWMREMPDATQHIRSKLALFWHNHFVTEYEVYDCPSYMWAYYNLLHVNCLGNFKSFVETMGTNPAMLNYLDGDQNIVDEPNENYARELMELFTMGENNGYTQSDIEEVARALTGWTQDWFECELPQFYPDLHDEGQKTIFGQTGNWNYQDVHDLIFTLRKEQVKEFICTKIYKHFVYDEVDADILAAMMHTFEDNNWELLPVFKQLFKSEHFFEDRYINAKIKSPFETFHSLIRITGMEYDVDYDADSVDYITFITGDMGQRIFNPPNVAGWPGQRAWLNENTLTLRWAQMQDILFGTMANNDATRDKLRQLAIDLTDTSNDVVFVTSVLSNYFLNTELDAGALETAVQYMKGEVPENYFMDGTWNLYFEEVPDQMINLLFYLTRLPEWQLN